MGIGLSFYRWAHLCYISKLSGIPPQIQIFGILFQEFTTNSGVRKREGGT